MEITLTLNEATIIQDGLVKLLEYIQDPETQSHLDLSNEMMKKMFDKKLEDTKSIALKLNTLIKEQVQINIEKRKLGIT